MELYEIEWVQATSDLTILSALSIILFFVFLYGSRIPDVIIDVAGSFPFKMFIGP